MGLRSVEGRVTDSRLRLRDLRNVDGFTPVCKNLQNMTWPKTSRADCCKSANHRDAKEFHSDSTRARLIRPRPVIVPVLSIDVRLEVEWSLCSYLIDPSLNHCEESKIGLRLARKGFVCEILQALRIPQHSREANLCLTWLTLRGICAIPSRPVMSHKCIVAGLPRCCWPSAAQIAGHFSTTWLETRHLFISTIK
jgi:hypothetical protein